MAFAFLKRYRDYKDKVFSEFYAQIETLLQNEQVRQLDQYIQHHCFTRLKHSLDVAYYSFFITRLFGWDCKSAARGGLLHDLFLYDWRDEAFSGKHHAVYHPRIALENARSICQLNKVEENIIRRHMWLITAVPPRYKEAYVVTFVDKYCAVREFLIGKFASDKRKAALTGINAA